MHDTGVECKGPTIVRKNVTIVCKDFTMLHKDLTMLRKDLTILYKDVTIVCKGVTVVCKDVTLKSSFLQGSFNELRKCYQQLLTYIRVRVSISMMGLGTSGLCRNYMLDLVQAKAGTLMVLCSGNSEMVLL